MYQLSACTRTVIPVSPQGKTGISQTQARARKDEVPAFGAPEVLPLRLHFVHVGVWAMGASVPRRRKGDELEEDGFTGRISFL